MSVLNGPGEGTWSVFAGQVVEERDALREKVVEQAKRIEKLEDKLRALQYPRCYLPPGEARTEALFALKILEAEERGARWALERHGHGLADMSREQYAREICEAARRSK